MDELIAKLEAATGPDRELDADICHALGFETMRGYPIGTDVDWLYIAPSNRDRRGWQRVPNFTESIDYAVTLIPEGWPIERMSWWPRTPIGYEDQRVCHVTVIALDHAGWGDARRQFSAKAITPAIALCIAALKARAAMVAEKGGER